MKGESLEGVVGDSIGDTQEVTEERGTESEKEEWLDDIAEEEPLLVLLPVLVPPLAIWSKCLSRLFSSLRHVISCISLSTTPSCSFSMRSMALLAGLETDMLLLLLLL